MIIFYENLNEDDICEPFCALIVGYFLTFIFLWHDIENCSAVAYKLNYIGLLNVNKY